MGKTVPMAYLITFTCYGTRLYGDEGGSVDRNHNVYGTPLLPPSTKRVRALQQAMNQETYELDKVRRSVVLEAIREVCVHRAWKLRAAHVRSTHVHLVVAAEITPEKILNDLKAYASRALNRAGLDTGVRKRWTHHGSTRYLWKPEQIGSAIHYVVLEQGIPMAVWKESEPEASATGQSEPNK